MTLIKDVKYGSRRSELIFFLLDLMDKKYQEKWLKDNGGYGFQTEMGFAYEMFFDELDLAKNVKSNTTPDDGIGDFFKTTKETYAILQVCKHLRPLWRESDDDAALKQVFGWNINIDALNKIPNELYYNADLSTTRKGQGIRFVSKQHDIRIMRGRPDGHPSQQQDYVKIVSNGKVGLRDGSFVSSGDIKKASHHSEAHIPLNEWMNWRAWNEK